MLIELGALPCPLWAPGLRLVPFSEGTSGTSNLAVFLSSLPAPGPASGAASQGPAPGLTHYCHRLEILEHRPPYDGPDPA